MTRTIFIAGALALAATLPAAPALAAGRTFVSTAGSDSNPCTVALPCRNLQAAYNAVAANGQVEVLDPGNYGSLTITGPVNIEGHGWAGMSTTTGAAITINAAGVTDNIFISGVVLDGLGITGTNGIQFNSGGSLDIQNSVIRNFSSNGVFLATSGPSNVSVLNTQVLKNNNGINFSADGSGATFAVLDHVQMVNNASNGLFVNTPSQTINVTVSDSVSANNGLDGIQAVATSSATINVMVRNSTIANNGFGLSSQIGNATIRVTRSTITGNGAGWSTSDSGKVLSYGDNNIDSNTNVNTEPPGPLTYK